MQVPALLEWTASGSADRMVAVRQTLPAQVTLAGDERLARLALGIQGVELLVEPLVGGLAGVDGAVQDRLEA